MNKWVLVAVVLVAVIVGLVFGIWPELDLRLSALFFDPERNGFYLAKMLPLKVLRAMTYVVVVIFAAAPFVALAMRFAKPWRPPLLSVRGGILMLSTLILVSGLIVNMGLKEHWGRPRPVRVTQFGGPESFVAWWDPHGECLTNCSFSGGEASSAFWTLVPAALAPPQWRAVSYALSIAFGSAVGLLRIAFGRHFFTDVFFSGVLNYVALWIMHGLFYRWPRTRLCEPRLERDLDQILSWLRTRARRISGNS